VLLLVCVFPHPHPPRLSHSLPTSLPFVISLHTPLSLTLARSLSFILSLHTPSCLLTPRCVFPHTPCCVALSCLHNTLPSLSVRSSPRLSLSFSPSFSPSLSLFLPLPPSFLVSDAHQDPWYNGPQRGYGRDEANYPGIALDAKAVQVFFLFL